MATLTHARASTRSEAANTGILLSTGTNEVEFMEFLLAGTAYAVNVAKVLRVISAQTATVTTVPEAPKGVAGVIYDQNRPVQLIDLRIALGLPTDSTPPERQLILIAHFNSVATAFIIDGIQKIHRTSWSQFEPISHALGDGGFVTGTIKVDERILLVLDLERLLLDYTPRDRTAATAAATASAALAPARARHRILYAEDSALIRRATADFLRKAGYSELVLCEDGQIALEKLEKERAAAGTSGATLRSRISVVLTDIEMPRLDGLTLCRLLRQTVTREQGPFVVVYSSLINDDMQRRCRSVGTDRELSKPASEQILGALDELLGIGR